MSICPICGEPLIPGKQSPRGAHMTCYQKARRSNLLHLLPTRPTGRPRGSRTGGNYGGGPRPGAATQAAAIYLARWEDIAPVLRSRARHLGDDAALAAIERIGSELATVQKVLTRT